MTELVDRLEQANEALGHYKPKCIRRTKENLSFLVQVAMFGYCTKGENFKLQPKLMGAS